MYTTVFGFVSSSDMFDFSRLVAMGILTIFSCQHVHVIDDYLLCSICVPDQTQPDDSFPFLFFLLGKVSSKIRKRDQGKSQLYSWNRCYFCKRKCRSTWPGMHLKDTHADEHCYGWLLKTLETAVGHVFPLLFCMRKQDLKGKDGVQQHHALNV